MNEPGIPEHEMALFRTNGPIHESPGQPLIHTHKLRGMIFLMMLIECWTSSVAERPCEGSRGFQPTVLWTGGYCVAARRLMGWSRIVFPGFRRRSATQAHLVDANPWVETHGYHHEVATATKTAVLQSRDVYKDQGTALRLTDSLIFSADGSYAIRVPERCPGLPLGGPSALNH